jgi:hypothetical protein
MHVLEETNTRQSSRETDQRLQRRKENETVVKEYSFHTLECIQLNVHNL